MVRLRVFILLILTTSLFAQANISARLDEASVRVGETMNLTVTLSGPLLSGPEPQLPKMSGLQATGSTSSSTNVQFVNGRSSMRKDIVFELRATSEGKATIDPVTLNYRGKTYATNMLTVNVLPLAARSSEGVSGNENVFVRVTADKRSAYVGEEIILTYKIYFAVQITSPEIAQLPRTSGFWSEDIDLPPQMSLRDEVIGGRAYKSGTFRKVALFPTTAGALTVEPIAIRTKVEKKARDSRQRINDPFFGDPFFSLGRSMEPIEIYSPTVEIQVRPLPEAGRPAAFNGAVGKYTIRTSLDRTECLQHDAVTLQIQIRGEGNIKTLSPPEIELSADFENYEPKSTEKLKRDQTGISGLKSFEYVLIPRTAGKQKLPGIDYVYFDPEQEEYITASSTPLTLVVNRNERAQSGDESVPMARKRGVETIGTDIAFVKTDPGSFVSTVSAPHKTVSFWVLTCGPWVALAAFAVVFQQRMKSVAGRFNLKRALAKALLELTAADRIAAKEQTEAACRHAANALDFIVSSFLEREQGTLTLDEIKEIWRYRELREDWLDVILTAYRETDRLRFAAAKNSGGDIRFLVSEVRKLIVAIESEGGKA